MPRKRSRQHEEDREARRAAHTKQLSVVIRHTTARSLAASAGSTSRYGRSAQEEQAGPAARQHHKHRGPAWQHGEQRAMEGPHGGGRWRRACLPPPCARRRRCQQSTSGPSAPTPTTLTSRPSAYPQRSACCHSTPPSGGTTSGPSGRPAATCSASRYLHAWASHVPPGRAACVVCSRPAARSVHVQVQILRASQCTPLLQAGLTLAGVGFAKTQVRASPLSACKSCQPGTPEIAPCQGRGALTHAGLWIMTHRPAPCNAAGVRV